MSLCFLTKKKDTISNLWKRFVEEKAAEPYAALLLLLLFLKNTWLWSYKCTQETRLRVLQWKMLHNIYSRQRTPFRDETEGTQQMFMMCWCSSFNWALFFRLMSRRIWILEIHRRIYFAPVRYNDKAIFYRHLVWIATVKHKKIS